MNEYKVGEKKAKGMIYDNLVKLLPPGTKRNTILKQTQRARSIYKLFEKIGIDKIKYITTYSANSISELSDSQIQTIIDYFSENPNTEFSDDRDDLLPIPKRRFRMIRIMYWKSCLQRNQLHLFH
jgi:hypothetical protein